MRAIGLVALLSIGCAGQRYVSAGKMYADQGDWVNAHARLVEAQAYRPGSRRLAERLETYRVRASDQLRQAFEQHLGAGDVSQAWGALYLGRELDPSARWVADGTRSIVGLRSRAVDEALATGRVEQAYRLAAEGRTWLPTEPAMGERLDLAREAVREVLQQALDGEAFQEALGAADLLAEVEPAAGHESERRRVESAWAGALRSASAQAMRRGRPAESFVRAAQVVQLSDTAADREALARARERFVQREGLVFDVRVQGADARARFVRQQLADSLPDVPGVAWLPDASHATVTGTLRLTNPICRSTAEARPAEHPYVAGVVEVANPAHLALRQEVDDLLREERATRRQLRAQEDRVAVAREDLEYARAEAVPLRREVRAQQQRLDEIIASEAGAVQALEESEQAVAELAAHSRRLESLNAAIRRSRHRTRALRASIEEAKKVVPVDLVALDALKSELNEAEQVVAAKVAERNAVPEPSDLVVQIAGQLEARRQALARSRRPAAEQRLQVFQARLDDAEQVVRGQLQRVRDEERAAEQLRVRAGSLAMDRQRAADRLARTAPTVGQEVVDVYAYEILEHTRTCAVTAVLDGRSNGRPVLQQQVQARQSTADAEVVEVPEVGLYGDPLEFPLTDDELIHAGDVAMVAELAPLFGEQVERWRDARLGALSRETTSEGRSRAALAAFLADPGRAESAVRDQIEGAYGLTDLDALLR